MTPFLSRIPLSTLEYFNSTRLYAELTQLKGNQMSCNKLKYPGNNTSQNSI